ncbi:MAG: hypothetical protein IIC02_07970, partial [Planctomycetes bacterium]|nr:hypothetical protein [Planctomycetota bacterium]
MNIRIFCFAVGLTATGTWAQVPIFKMWVTEVYEVNPDGSYTAKCGVNCNPPHGTQDLLPGIAQPGDLINIEVTVEGWDADMDAGECNVDHEVCSISAQDCDNTHCTGGGGACTIDDNCFAPATCKRDTCDKAPLVGAFQWTIDSSTYSNGGAGPGLAPAQLPCVSNGICLGGDNDGEPCEPLNGNADCSVGGICERSLECACAYTQVLPAFPEALNDCADFAALDGGFCTCSTATCDENTCGPQAAAYIDLSVIPGYLFFQHNHLQAINLSISNYTFGAFSSATPAGVPEALSRCNGGNRPICNVDADCLRCDDTPFGSCATDDDCPLGACVPLGTCEPVANSPYYLGTLLLEATGDSCGLFTIDLIQDLDIFGDPITTFLSDSAAARLPIPIVEPLFIDLGASVPCNDGDLCTENDEFCGGDPESCAGTPKICPPGETCILGNCFGEGCTFMNVTDATWADADPLATLQFDRPGDCAIDAREPHSINDLNAKEGWDRLVLKFSCDPTELAASLRPRNFAVETDPVEVSPPFIPAAGGFEADFINRTLTIHLDRSISPGFYTCITHLDSGKAWCAGYLPADAGQDGLSSAGDINALINAINLVAGLELPIYATDIN